MSLRHTAAVLICLPFGAAVADIPCPTPPAPVTDINHDVNSDVDLAVGKLGKARAGDISIKTEVVTRNLVKDLGHPERVYVIEMMAATYCAMLRDNQEIPERDKPGLWDKFSSKAYAFLGDSTPPPTPEASPKRPKKAAPSNAPPSPSGNVPSASAATVPVAVAPAASQPVAAVPSTPNASSVSVPDVPKNRMLGAMLTVMPSRPPPADMRPIGWSPDFFFSAIGMGRQETIVGIYFEGDARELVTIKDAYIISQLTGRKEQLAVFDIESRERLEFSEINQIPPNAHVYIGYEWKDHIAPRTFVEEWGKMEMVVDYGDNKKYVANHAEDYVRARTAEEMPGTVGPVITKKGDAN